MSINCAKMKSSILAKLLGNRYLNNIEDFLNILLTYWKHKISSKSDEIQCSDFDEILLPIGTQTSNVQTLIKCIILKFSAMWDSIPKCTALQKQPP